jgi:hypothetical protein
VKNVKTQLKLKCILTKSRKFTHTKTFLQENNVKNVIYDLH